MTEESKPADAVDGPPPQATALPSARDVLEFANAAASQPQSPPDLTPWDRRFCAVGGRIAAALILLVMFTFAGLIGWTVIGLIRTVWNDYVH